MRPLWSPELIDLGLTEQSCLLCGRIPTATENLYIITFFSNAGNEDVMMTPSPNHRRHSTDRDVAWSFCGPVVTTRRIAVGLTQRDGQGYAMRSSSSAK